jgi:hypothetical protein
VSAGIRAGWFQVQPVSVFFFFLIEVLVKCFLVSRAEDQCFSQQIVPVLGTDLCMQKDTPTARSLSIIHVSLFHVFTLGADSLRLCLCWVILHCDRDSNIS